MVEKGSELGLEVFAFLGFLCLSSVRWLCSESKALGNIMKAAIEVAVESRASSLVLATAANYHISIPTPPPTYHLQMYLIPNL